MKSKKAVPSPFEPILCLILIIVFMIIWYVQSYEQKTEDKPKTIHQGKDYIKLVDEVCYRTHNPNRTTNYRESWGSAYRDCIQQNIGIK